MPTSITCPRCGQHYTAEDFLLGQQIQCPACGSAIQVPAVQLPAPELPAPQVPAPELPAPELPAPTLAVPATRSSTRSGLRRRPQRKTKRLSWKLVAIIAASLPVIALASLLVIGAVIGFRRGVALGRGTDQWKTFSSDEFGFEAQLPANFVVRSHSKLPAEHAIFIEGRHRNAEGVLTGVDVDLALSPDAKKWTYRLFEFRSIRRVIRFPATGNVGETHLVEEGNYYKWDCAMSWGSSFCYVAVVGESRDEVDRVADQVYRSLKFRAPN